MQSAIKPYSDRNRTHNLPDRDGAFRTRSFIQPKAKLSICRAAHARQQFVVSHSDESKNRCRKRAQIGILRSRLWAYDLLRTDRKKSVRRLVMRSFELLRASRPVGSTMSDIALTSTSTTRPSMTPEERRVIFASSLGTVFEWYDFYLYATLAPFFAALFFPPGQRHRGAAVGLRHLRRRLPGAPVRRAGVRPHRRPRRPQVHLPRHHRGDGRRDLRGRPAADLRSDRLAGAGPAGRRCACCRASRSAASTAAPRPTSPSMRARTSAATPPAGSRPRRRSASSWRCWSSASAASTWTPKTFAEWGWRIPFLVSLVLLVFSVYIRLKLNESPVFQRMKAEGKGSKAPLTDSFLRYPNNKYVLLALLGATAGQGVVWYTGQFYALFFLTITLKLDYLTAYTLIGAVAADRHAVLHLLRLAVRPDRPAEDHPGRLPDRGAHLLPAVQGADPLRQPGAGGVPAEEPDHGRRPTSRPATSTSSSGRGRSSPTATGPRTS